MNSKLKIFILFPIFFQTYLLSYADCYLALKKNHRRILTFFKGSEVVYMARDLWYSGVIDSIGENYFIVKNEKFSLDEIQYLKIYRKSCLYKQNSVMLFLSGSYFLTTDIINSAINEGRITLSESTIYMSSSFFTGGFLLNILSERKYRIGGKFKLAVFCG